VDALTCQQAVALKTRDIISQLKTKVGAVTSTTELIRTVEVRAIRFGVEEWRCLLKGGAAGTREGFSNTSWNGASEPEVLSPCRFVVWSGLGHPGHDAAIRHRRGSLGGLRAGTVMRRSFWLFS
jgi:hypothetical protein